MAKSLTELVGAAKAAQIERELRQGAEDLFEKPGTYSSLEDIRDNIWEMYLGGAIIADHGGKAVGAARRLYDEIFEQIAEKHGVGKNAERRRRFVRQLASALQDKVTGYKKIDPDDYQPTAADLAKLREVSIGNDCAFPDLLAQLTGLEELSICEAHGKRAPGEAKSVATAIAAPGVRRLELNDDVGDAIDGAIENPVLANVDYLALYDAGIKPAQLAAALERWPKLETLAIRGKVSAKMLDVVATAAPRLVELALVNAEIRDAALEALLVERKWPKLKRLFLWGHELGAAMKKKLAAALPSAKIKAGD